MKMKMKIQKIIKLLKEDWKTQIFTVFFLLLCFAIYFEVAKNSEQPAISLSGPLKSVDHFVPAGYGLISLNFVNKNALLKVLGSTGVVDLIHPVTHKIVIQNLKVLRAPNAPDDILGLFPESLSLSLLKTSKSYFAVIKNPNLNSGMNLVKESKRKKRWIVIGQGSQ